MCLLSWKAQWNSVMRGTLQAERKCQCLAAWVSDRLGLARKLRIGGACCLRRQVAAPFNACRLSSSAHFLCTRQSTMAEPSEQGAVQAVT